MKTVKKLTTEQKAVVQEMEAFRARLRSPVPAFCRQWTEHSADVFRRMCRDIYTGDVEKVIESYRMSLEELRAQFAPVLTEISPARPTKPYVHTDTTRVIVDKIDEALRNRNHRRVGLILGPAGAGKTELLQHLSERFGGKIVGATEAWRRSYTEGMADIFEAFAPHAGWRTRGELQRSLFGLLRQPVIRPDTGKASPALLLLDDSNTWGPHTWNMVRDIINRTPAVVVAAGLTEIIDKLCARSFAEASQVMKRALFCYELPPLEGADVEPFLAPLGLNGTLKAAAAKLAEQANVFGRFELVERVVEALALERGHRSMEQVSHAIAAEQATIRLAIHVQHLRRHEADRLANNRKNQTNHKPALSAGN